MISLVSGPPGNGKSFYAIRKVTQALDEGKPVAGNVELRQGWPQKLARHNWVFWLRRLARRKFLREAGNRYHYTEDLGELFRIRLRGEGEGRGLMVLDEAHNWMNARSWSARDREEIVRFFTQHRKLGWDVILIAQHPEMIDKQVRNLCEYNIYLRNLKKARWGGLPIFPVNLFLAVWCWHSAQRVVVKREVFPLSWRKDLYDTDATSHGLVGDEAEGGTLWLPSPPADRMQLAPRTDGRTRPGAAGRPPAGAPDAPSAGAGSPDGAEHAGEAGEPETWAAAAPLDPPPAAGSSNSHPGLIYETDKRVH
ncbi:MAG: zonular occludens toxin domain-containing protein [Solirubrobacterales bacterium]